MAYLLDVAKQNSELVSSIIGSIDVGSAIGNAITFSTDLARAQETQARLNAYFKVNLAIFSSRAIEYAKLPGDALIARALKNLPFFNQFVVDNTVNQLAQSAGGFRAAGSMLGLETKTYTALNQIDMLNTILYSVPEAVCRLKSARYFNKLLAVGLPSERDAFILARNSAWSWSMYIDLLQTEFGLTEKDASSIQSIRGQQIGKPSLREVYFWVQKGFVTDAYFYRLAQWGLGFSKDDAANLYKNFDYDLSPMEIFRITDLTNVSAAWIDKKLTALGLNKEDKVLMKTMILNRAAKAELDKTWNILLDHYAWGLETDASLTDFLVAHKIDAAESASKLNIAVLLREKIVMQLLRDAEIYLFRKDTLNETQLLNRLEGLNITIDISNAIVRNEAAKKGVDWEIPTP